MVELQNAGPVPAEGIAVQWAAIVDFFSDLSRPEGLGRDCEGVILSQSETGEMRANLQVQNFPTCCQVGKFTSSWNPHGKQLEHWFHQCYLLRKEEEYTSGSGATGTHTYLVAYQGHVEVNFFRRNVPSWCTPLPIPAMAPWGWNMEQVNATHWLPPEGHRGYAVSSRYISDDTARLIRIELGEEARPEPTVCRHNPAVQVGVAAIDPKALPRLLCTFCRGRGIRWEEFSARNRADTCPYFRRACKSVTERSDQLPYWFEWHGQLLASYRRLAEGEYEAFEAVYLRKRDGFIRRSVVLLNNTTKEAWMYPYNGFIPPTLAAFRGKYPEASGRQIVGAEKSEGRRF